MAGSGGRRWVVGRLVCHAEWSRPAERALSGTTPVASRIASLRRLDSSVGRWAGGLPHLLGQHVAVKSCDVVYDVFVIRRGLGAECADGCGLLGVVGVGGEKVEPS